MKIPTKIFSKFKVNRGGHFLGFGLNPETDWKLIILSFIFLLVVVLTLGSYFFIRVNSGDFIEVSEEETPQSTFNINRVRQTIKYYEDKSKQLENIKVTPENILDPSI